MKLKMRCSFQRFVKLKKQAEIPNAKQESLQRSARITSFEVIPQKSILMLTGSTKIAATAND